ncbi:MAG: leucine-rich repeat protein, partial [Spirochaetaceae bacterium]|nr:leucine-rich repeat protein [Spirochaetaceae bacterium]
MKKWLLSVLCTTVLLFFSCNSMSGGLDGNHVVSVDPNVSGGKIILSENRFKAGDAVRVTVEAGPGRKLEPGSLSYKIGRKYVPIKSNRFFMPSSDITVSAVFSYEYDVSLALDVKKVYIGSEEEFQIYPIIHSDKLDVTSLKVLWSTSDQTIANISDDGVVVGINKGYTYVSAMLPDYALEAICEVYVTDLDFTIDKDLRIITGWTGTISGDTLEIPAIVDGVKIQGIGERAFASLTGVNNVVIPPEVSILYDNVFDGSTIKNVVFTTESPIGIGNNCFANCPNLESVVLSGDFVAFAGKEIFQNCPSLKKVEVPQTQVASYLTTEGWKKYIEYICCSHEYRITVADLPNGSITVNRYAAAFDEKVVVSTNAD